MKNRKILRILLIMTMFIFINKKDCLAWAKDDTCENIYAFTDNIYEQKEEHVYFESEDETGQTTLEENQKYEPEEIVLYCDEHPCDESGNPAGIDTTLTSADTNDGPYDCKDYNPITKQWEETGNCPDEQDKKARDMLAANGYTCVTAVETTFLDMKFKTIFPVKAYEKRGDGKSITIMLWDDSTPGNIPYATHPGYAVDAYEYSGPEDYQGLKTFYDTKEKLIGTRIYDFYALNIDNKQSRFYNNGNYKRFIEGQEDGALEMTFSSKKDMDQGTTEIRRVRFQDYKFTRHFLITSLWSHVYWDYGAVGDCIYYGSGVEGHHFDYRTYQQSFIAQGGSYGSASIALNSSEMDSFNINSRANMALSFEYDNGDGAVTQLKELNDNAQIFGDYKRGLITINYDTMTWTWDDHRDGTLAQVYVLQPEIRTRTYTVCMGQYHCDCEDINVLCSCEDEEAGCSPSIGCKDGKECEGPPADDDGGCKQGEPDCNEEGESPMKYNPDGHIIPSGGIGGVTGKGSQDYYNTMLDGSTTLVE